MNKTPLEIYISKPAFKHHVNKVVYLFDPHRRFIDDVIQDFCLYYLRHYDKAPNIRKLYNCMINKLKYEKRYVMVDYNEFIKKVDEIIDDNCIDV